mgnify:CR=1 FL=1
MIALLIGLHSVIEGLFNFLPWRHFELRQQVLEVPGDCFVVILVIDDYGVFMDPVIEAEECLRG